MYKTAGGKIRFSFSRFVTNAVPNFANDGNADDANISPKQQDDLFAYQMRLDNPKIFDDLSLFACGIVDVKQHSRSVLSALQKVGIVNKTDGSIHTELITKNFPNQVPVISIHKQRRVVSLLFFWEEELTRWRLLDEEEAEIRQAMEVHGDQHEPLKIALGTVQVKRSMPPSLRGSEGKAGAVLSGPSGGNGEASSPPGYHDTKRTVSVSGGRYHQAGAGQVNSSDESQEHGASEDEES